MSDCIEFQGCILPNGYGQKVWQGKQRGAHRVAYCVHHGIDIAAIDGQVIRHNCDNRACVNPEHLELGSQRDNIQDRVDRGRSAVGERHGRHRVTAEIVRQIRQRCIPGSKENGQSALAREFGISQMQVWAIVSRKTWKHV